MSRREELAARIRELAAKASTWTAAEETEWNAVNAEYDSFMDAERLRRNPRIGRDGGRIGDNSSDVDQAFAAYMRNASGLPIPSAEFQAAERLGFDPRGGAFNIALPTGTPRSWRDVMNSAGSHDGSQGGYTVASTLQASLVSAMKDYSGVLQAAEVWITTDGRDAAWPTCDDTSNTGSQVGENTDVGSATDLAFGQITFKSYKLTSGVLKASHELVRDSALNIAEVVGRKLGERLGRILNTKATTGPGANTLSGIVTGATLGVTAGSATAITFDELIQLQHSIDPAYRAGPGCGWMMNDGIASYVRRLKDGDGNYLWTDSLQEGQPPRLLGFPVFLNQDMASSVASSAKTVLFGKLNEFKIRIVNGVRTRQLNERYAELDQVGFISFLEADSCLMKPSTTDSLCPVRYLQQA